MGRYILRRVLYTIPVLFIITLIVFSLIHLIPGDPVKLIYSIEGTEERIEKAREKLNLDKPVIVQYGIWMRNLSQGQMGESLRSGEEVAPIIFKKLGTTAILTFSALLISITLSIILGVIAASRRNTTIDFGVMTLAVFGISIPVFWTGILVVLLFAVRLGLLPAIGYESFLENPAEAFRHLTLPALTLGFALAGYTTRMTRSQMIDVLNQDYIRTARAKGVKEGFVIYKHALKNALIPVVTAIGLQLGFLMGGAVLVEQIFAWPGIGQLLIHAIFNRDYIMIQGITLVVAVLFVLINLIVDIIYAFLNPKIRYQ